MGHYTREARRMESIPKLVETRVTSGRSGCGMSLAIGMDDPEFLLNRGCGFRSACRVTRARRRLGAM